MRPLTLILKHPWRKLQFSPSKLTHVFTDVPILPFVPLVSVAWIVSAHHLHLEKRPWLTSTDLTTPKRWARYVNLIDRSWHRDMPRLEPTERGHGPSCAPKALRTFVYYNDVHWVEHVSTRCQYASFKETQTHNVSKTFKTQLLQYYSALSHNHLHLFCPPCQTKRKTSENPIMKCTKMHKKEPSGSSLVRVKDWKLDNFL